MRALGELWWLHFWAGLAGQEGELPGGYAVGDVKQTLVFLGTRCFSFCYQRTLGLIPVGTQSPGQGSRGPSKGESSLRVADVLRPAI